MPPREPGPPIESWKDIAGWFGVTVRTVQKWEQDRGLPIHRMPGVKGRVYAYPAELEAWRSAHPLDLTAEPATAPPPTSTLPRRLAAAAIFLAVFFSVAWWFYRLPGPPVTYHLEGTVLAGIDAKGGEVWRFNLPSTPAQDWKTNPDAMSPPSIGDIDGDGRVETLFPFASAAQQTESGSLLCIGEDGVLKWKFVAGRKVATRKQEFAETFRVGRFSWVGLGRNRPRALLVLSINFYYPFQVALLDPGGRLQREYWHSGHLSSLAQSDVDGDGKDEIFLAGISNGYRRATVVQLDPLTMEGASREEDPDYQLLEMPKPREVARILFPRSRAFEGLDRYNAASLVRAERNAITVAVREVPSWNPSPVIYYTLSPKLELREVSPEDGFQSWITKRLGASEHMTSADLAALRNLRYIAGKR